MQGWPLKNNIENNARIEYVEFSYRLIHYILVINCRWSLCKDLHIRIYFSYISRFFNHHQMFSKLILFKPKNLDNHLTYQKPFTVTSSKKYKPIIPPNNIWFNQTIIHIKQWLIVDVTISWIFLAINILFKNCMLWKEYQLVDPWCN